MEGEKFNRLTTKTYLGRLGKEQRHTWECVCECGALIQVSEKNLKTEHTKSCGCLKAEGNRRTHGHTSRRNPSKSGYSPTYQCWQSMLQRCYHASQDSYYLYGGRGIEVCDRWRDSFENFLADMGERPQGTTLDRFPDKDGNYEPGNCRWATDLEQANNKRNNISVTIEGECKTLTQWARLNGISMGCVYTRIFRLGWDAERAVTTPARPMRKNHGIR